jgi:hypothetical protein
MRTRFAPVRERRLAVVGDYLRHESPVSAVHARNKQHVPLLAPLL